MTYGFWREFPAAVIHRILAVDLDPGDTIIRRDTVRKVKLSVQIDLDESADMSLLCLVQLIVTPPPGVLPVVNLVKRVA